MQNPLNRAFSESLIKRNPDLNAEEVCLLRQYKRELDQANHQIEKLSRHFTGAFDNEYRMFDDSVKKQSRDVQRSHYLQHIINTVPVAIIVLNEKGIVIEANSYAEQIFQMSVTGVPWKELVSSEFSPKADDGNEVSLANGKRVHLETRSLSPESGQLIVINDLTKTRELQDKVSRNNRLTLMGNMLASLAHQIRTPLSSAMLYASQIGCLDASDGFQSKAKRKIIASLSNIEKQMKEMLLFAKGASKSKSYHSVGQMIALLKNYLMELEQDIDKQFINQVTDESKGVVIHLDDVMGAVVNIIENAVHAISQSDSSLKEQRLTLKIAEENDSLVITVSDTGPGIDDEVINQIFEPFYTSKRQGTGLGLAIAKNVFSENNIKLLLRTKKSVGTSFAIEIPTFDPDMLSSCSQTMLIKEEY